jgi:hypothetical protein
MREECFALKWFIVVRFSFLTAARMKKTLFWDEDYSLLKCTAV